MSRIVLGIDPGTASTGYGAVIEESGRLRYLSGGVIKTPSDMPMPDRLLSIHKQLEQVIVETKPEIAAIETIYFNSNQKSAVQVAQARGVAVMTCRLLGVGVTELTPLQVKMALCNAGRADKEQVEHMVRLLLNLNEVPKAHHTSDALAMAITLIHTNTDLKRSIMGVSR
ncbi:MAG TPA: crossover junction endodeoxyribonuclease RuvC [Bacillota bacterium]|nr:crossover junction endodeoxyribonuclease RuvC [Bacillota bacterium]HOH10919.1 crossover junction endodeoxyribonuclease RuvC [Bacillota bacterium]HOS50176.1 crossover junction endodeoxyribonuclease RuvC [Bacillota bacterium]HOY88811.1 crossover junction endodeoxyribonuclease RuvC [Bacillota bacterium]HPI01901.1 crossover junction endodeoxyribonuclease RuvC [Bacillota bacterium]